MPDLNELFRNANADVSISASDAIQNIAIAVNAKAIPKSHVHRCMRCKQEFRCLYPGECTANYEVLPRIPDFTVGEFVDHCYKDSNGKWMPNLGFMPPSTDAREPIPLLPDTLAGIFGTRQAYSAMSAGTSPNAAAMSVLLNKINELIAAINTLRAGVT